MRYISSAAQYLYDFFVSTDQEGRAVRPLFEACYELEDDLKAIELAQGKVWPYLDLLPRLREKLKEHSFEDMGAIDAGEQDCRLDHRDLALLDLAIERTQLAGEMNPERSTTLRALLSEVRKLVTNDESVDPQLRLFIARAVLAVENALDEYEISGEFRLRDALVRLFGLLRTAEASSEEPARWKESWDKYGVPVATGLIASVPQLVLTGVTIMQTLGSA